MGHVLTVTLELANRMARDLAAQAWEEGRCAAALGVKNNPYINQTEEAPDARA